VSGEDKSKVYETLNRCTENLTKEMAIGTVGIYVTIERHEYNELLKAITEAKKLLVKDGGLYRDW